MTAETDKNDLGKVSKPSDQLEVLLLPDMEQALKDMEWLEDVDHTLTSASIALIARSMNVDDILQKEFALAA